LHAKLFRGICIKYVKAINLLCAGNEVWKNMKFKGVLTPTSPPLPYILCCDYL